MLTNVNGTEETPVCRLFGWMMSVNVQSACLFYRLHVAIKYAAKTTMLKVKHLRRCRIYLQLGCSWHIGAITAIQHFFINVYALVFRNFNHLILRPFHQSFD